MITEHIADSLVCLSEFVGGWHPGVNSRSNFHSGKRGRSYHGKADVTMKKPITTAENQYSINCNESSAEHIYAIMNGEKVMKYSFPKGKHGKQPKSR
jgi:hypothetical protein